jgi:pimeloyl-[acyl-carrier protein] synthase
MSVAPPDPLRGINPSNRDAIYRELRERTPVHWSSVHAGWVLTRYADVSAVLRHADVTGLDAKAFFEEVGRRGGLDLSNLLEFVSSLSFMNLPPRHDAIRRFLLQLLGGLRRQNLTALLEQKASALLAAAERKGTIDLADGYGRALALFAAGTMLGIAEGDVFELGRLGSELTVVFERSMPSVATLKKLDARAAALIDYFERQIQSRRKSPTDDGVSLLVRLADESFTCSDRELAGYCAFFFIAAEENTAIAISASCRMLLNRPALRARLHDNPSRVSNAAREFLRLATPVQFVIRQSRSDLEIAGQRIGAGEPMILMLGAADRDPEVYPDPDEPDLDRSGPEPLAFSAGPHRCLGAQLATLELEIAIRGILAYPRLRLSAQPVWAPRMNIAPLERLEAHFE